MEELLKAIGCPVFMSQDYEADDYAASLVEKFRARICRLMCLPRITIIFSW